MRVLILLFSLAAGILLPQAHGVSVLITPALMLMLFFAFLKIEWASLLRPEPCQWRVVVLPPVLGWLAYFALSGYSSVLADAGFLAAAAPTALATSVMVGFLGGSVAFAATTTFLGNLAAGFYLPLSVWWMGKGGGATPSLGSLWGILIPTLQTLLVPLLLAWGIRRFVPQLASGLGRFKHPAFYAWMFTVFASMSRASHHVHEQGYGFGVLWPFAAVALAVCVLNFVLGWVVGARELRWESSQCLGQKNTILTIWVALNFLDPLAVLGPLSYLVFHNLWNALQLWRAEQKEPLRHASTGGQ